jgi:hypothetical protein
MSMKRILVVAFVLAAGSATVAWLRSPGPAVAQQPPRRPQWQYAVYYHSDLMALGEKTAGQNLTKLGEQGWELVAVTPGIRGDKGEEVTAQTTYLFKRPK